MLIALLNNPDFEPEKCNSLRCTIISGAAATKAQIEMFQEKLPNDHFLSAYGLSEMAPVSMTGYEGKNFAVTVDWFEEQQCWQIYNQKIGTYNFDDGVKGDIWFLGEDVEGALFLSELPICVGGMSEDGTLVCLPFEGELEMQDGSTFNYAVNDMLYIAYFGGEDLSYISNTFETGYPTFPMTITPAASTSAVVKDTAKKSSKNTMLPTPFKAYDFNKSAKVRF
jgi:fatty-acyl-CoA synthase